MNNPPLVEANEIQYIQDGVCILNDVSLCVEQGDRLAIVGPNGAGKSTLIKILLGLIQPSSGSVSIEGKNIATLARNDMALSIAYVPQLLQSEIAFTVRQFVTMGRYAHGAEGDGVIERAIAAVSMEGFEDRRVSSLSGGERQRACIAAALAQESRIIIFDEPLAHLDPRQRVEVQHTLYRLDTTITQVVVTHDLDWVEKCFNKVVAMDGGSIVYKGGVNDFYSRRIDRDIFGDHSLSSLGGER